MERLMLSLAALAVAGALHAQDTRKALHDGNVAFRKNDKAKAIEEYSAADKDPRGVFNLGNVYYSQDSFPDAQKAYERAAAMAKDPQDQARAYHNLGNAALKANKYEEAVRSYKEALKRAPNDDDTRYNLIYAMKKLAQQQQQKQPKPQDQQQQPQQQQQQQQKPEPKPQERIDKQDALRMLDAMQQQEKETQAKARAKQQPKKQVPVEKDW